MNSHPQVVAYLIAHPDKIVWDAFSRNTNPQAVEYLLARPDEKKYWIPMSANPFIFELNKEKMRATKSALHEDLVKHFLHPDKIAKWIASGQEALEYPYFE